MLIVIGVFVWIGATQEAATARMRSALSATPTRLAMLTDFEVLGPNDTLADAARASLRAPHRGLPVVDDGRIAGMLTESDMLAALAEFGEQRPVTLVMRSEFPVAESTEMLETVFQRMIDCGCETILVVRNKEAIGLVTMDILRELMAIDATVQKRRARLGLRNAEGKL
jgi:predicted transcriptional regulator